MGGERRGDAWSGALLLALAAAYGLAAGTIGPGDGEPGPGFVPSVLAKLLAALAVWIIASGLRQARGTDDDAPETPPAEAARPTGRGAPVRSWLAALASVAYVALFQPLGFVPSTLAYAAALAGLFTRDRRYLVTVPVGVTLALFVFFRLALGVRLPAGLFG